MISMSERNLGSDKEDIPYTDSWNFFRGINSILSPARDIQGIHWREFADFEFRSIGNWSAVVYADAA